MKDLQIRIVDDITTEPVTVAEAKTFCRVTGSAEDSCHGCTQGDGEIY
jgi:hypothetical protein